jgi:hypothetical protein
MKSGIILAATILLLTSLEALPATIHVPNDQATIQAGIDAAAEGDTVLVAPGTYHETIHFSGRNIVLGSLFMTTSDEELIDLTVIDGNQGGSVVTFDQGEDLTTVFRGFTVTGGSGTYTNPYGNDMWFYIGGGIFCHGASPRLRDLRIKDNSVSDWGGGIFLWESNAFIEDVIISDNSAYSGGGVENWVDADVFYRNVEISGNSASYSAGGICIVESDPRLECMTITGNSALVGGGSQIVNSDAILERCVITYNSAVPDGMAGGIMFWNFGGEGEPVLRQVLIVHNESHTGGGIFCEGQVYPRLENVTVAHNEATYEGGGIECLGSAIINCIFWDNTPDEILHYGGGPLSVSWSDIQGGYCGTGNINLDPLFRNLDYDDYHLMSTEYGFPQNSPCIDAGDPQFTDVLLDSLWGLGTVLSDMGAYGGGTTLVAGINDEEGNVIPVHILPLSNYPNPLNPRTTISYELACDADVTLSIFDVRGRLVVKLVEGRQEAGPHEVAWQAVGLASGVYICHLHAGDLERSLKMVLLK